MKCSIVGCSGQYEKRTIDYTLRYKGQLRIISDVPAEVCQICGDIVLAPDTVRKLQKFRKASLAQVSVAPVYRFAKSPSVKRVMAAGWGKRHFQLEVNENTAAPLKQSKQIKGSAYKSFALRETTTRQTI